MRHHPASQFPLRPPLEQLRAIRRQLHGYIQFPEVEQSVSEMAHAPLPKGADFHSVILNPENYGEISVRVAFEVFSKKAGWKPHLSSELSTQLSGNPAAFNGSRFVMNETTGRAFQERYPHKPFVPWHEGNGVLVVPARIGEDGTRAGEFEFDLGSVLWLLIGATRVIENEDLPVRIACRGTQFRGRGGALFIPRIAYRTGRVSFDLASADECDGWASFKGMSA